jgi:hypothetical protein
MRWTEFMKIRNSYKILVGKPRTDHFGDIVIDGWITLYSTERQLFPCCCETFHSVDVSLFRLAQIHSIT